MEGLKPVASSLPGEAPETQGPGPEIIQEYPPIPPKEPTPTQDERLALLESNVRVMMDAMQKLPEQLKRSFEVYDAQRFPQQQQGFPNQLPTTQQGGIMDFIMKMGPNLMGNLGGGSPMDTIYMEAGKKLVDGTLDSAIKRVIKQLGGEGASHVIATHG